MGEISAPLTAAQIENWRNAMLPVLGPYALIMPEEQIERLRAHFQGIADNLDPEGRVVEELNDLLIGQAIDEDHLAALEAQVRELTGLVREFVEDVRHTADPITWDRTVQLFKQALATELLTRRARDVEREKEIKRLRKVVEAAKARFEVWTRETYIALDDALAAYERGSDAE